MRIAGKPQGRYVIYVSESISRTVGAGGELLGNGTTLVIGKRMATETMILGRIAVKSQEHQNSSTASYAASNAVLAICWHHHGTGSTGTFSGIFGFHGNRESEDEHRSANLFEQVSVAQCL